MLLTDQERQRFADWLKIEADSSEAMAGQMKKISVPFGMADHLGQRADACRLIERLLRSSESMTIGED